MTFFSPSMMCAKYNNLENEIKKLEKTGVERLHLDVMDGRFVPNFAMGLNDVRCVAQIADIKTELHLMIERPSEYIAMFANTGVDIIFIHPESEYHPTVAIQEICRMGKTPGIVLSPGISLESVMDLFGVVKKVMVMCVNPGHAGQMYLPFVDHKIERLIEIKNDYNLEISIDGACSADRIRRWYKAGVDGFVLGTAALFGQKGTYQEIISKLRGICDEIHEKN